MKLSSDRTIDYSSLEPGISITKTHRRRHCSRVVLQCEQQLNGDVVCCFSAAIVKDMPTWRAM
jgi:hypothetical protein